MFTIVLVPESNGLAGGQIMLGPSPDRCIRPETIRLDIAQREQRQSQSMPSALGEFTEIDACCAENFQCVIYFFLNRHVKRKAPFGLAN